MKKLQQLEQPSIVQLRYPLPIRYNPLTVLSMTALSMKKGILQAQSGQRWENT